MEEELVSIIMPSYNTGKFIKETINSVIAQTYSNWELIIVDDCSTDNTDEIVKSINDNRIIYLKNETNSGAAISRNKALREAKGRWIAFLDSDDLWKNDKLEKQIKFMKENNCYFSYTNYIEIDENDNTNGKRITGPKKITKTGMFNYCWPGCLTVMYYANKIGLIQIEDIKKNNDYAMWLKVCKKADCYLLSEDLAMYRKRNGSISNHSYTALIKWHYKLYREAEHQNFICSLFNTCRNMVFGVYKKKKYVSKRKYKLSVCGHFGGNNNFCDGQTVKTKNIYQALCEYYGEEKINKIDTYNWKKHPISFLYECINGMKNSQNMIILPAQNGVKVFVPLFLIINKFYKRKIFYVVIGGWLPGLIKNKQVLIRKLRMLNRIFVETNNMKEQLKKLNIENVEVLVNFKNITPLKEEELKFEYNKPYKLCTFSRVIYEKGIEDAIQVVRKINEEYNKIIYELDIYGPIDEEYKDRFTTIVNNAPEYIQYKGCIDSKKSVNTLKNYYLLLFPTKFKTEGIPGTIIDALSAGVPIIASRWDNVEEIISHEKNGLIYDFNDLLDFKINLEKMINTKSIKNMKKECLIETKKFQKENVIERFVKEF